MALNWKGEELKRKTSKASRLAVDATMSAAVIHAGQNHGVGAHSQQRFIWRLGGLGPSIRIIKAATTNQFGTIGRWGTRGIAYARRIELGFQGKDSAGRSVDAPAYPFLKPGADAEYPNLLGRIKRAMAHA